jgi:hypothetical protein
MASSLCNTGGVSSILSALGGSTPNARSQAAMLASLAQEARSVAVSSNSAMASDPLAGGSAGFASAMRGEYIQGLRNRLMLKYSGIDYEFFNVYDLRYRDGVAI